MGVHDAWGLGGPIGGKFRPWEAALEKAKTFFPEPDAFSYFNANPTATRLPPESLSERIHEKLPGNTFLYEFLRHPPEHSPALDPDDISQYRDAARLFILLGSLAHLVSNASPAGEPVPAWIATPLLALAHRLDVEPALSGHFMVVDNWQWQRKPHDARFDVNEIKLLYPAFGHSHERTYHTIPACMAYALRELPFALLDLIRAMRDYAAAHLADRSRTEPRQQMLELLHAVSTALAHSKEEFQRISTDPTHRTHVSKHVFIRHMQPFHKGIVLAGPDGTVRITKGMSGLHFVSYHLLDAVLGRYHFGQLGELARMEEVDKYYTPPQRQYSACLSRLGPDATLRGFLELIDADTELRRAFNLLIESYAGESGVLSAHARKLFSYMHNNLQVDTSAEGASSKSPPVATPALNHETALRMFRVMNEAVRERRRLRMAPLFSAAKKTVVHRADDGAFAIIDLECVDGALHYQGSDAVRVLVPRAKDSARELQRHYFSGVETLAPSDLASPEDRGWGWGEHFEALGWPTAGVTPEILCEYIEAVVPATGGDGDPIFQPASPRVYSVCGTQRDRLRILISRPRDGRSHFGFSRMADPTLSEVFIACAPGLRFNVPPAGSNLVMVAGGTGISPFVSLVRDIGDLPGSFTLIHQASSSDVFLANLDTWQEFTRINSGALVMGFLSRGGGSAAERVLISGGAVTEQVQLSSGSQAYYFLSETVVERLRSVNKPGNNLAYCCGGTQSTVSPLRHLLSTQDWSYEFHTRTYGVERRLSRRARLFKAGSKLVDAAQVREAHPGGPQIIDQVYRLASQDGTASGTRTPDVPPELTALFHELHPDGENLLRLLNTPSDDEFQSFAELLEEEAERGVVIEQVAPQYVAAALAYPGKLNVVKIALQLETSALEQHLVTIGRPADTPNELIAVTIAAASGCLQNCEDLLSHLPADDANHKAFAHKLEKARQMLSSPAFVFDARSGSRAGGAGQTLRIEISEQFVQGVLVLRVAGRLDSMTSQSFQDKLQRHIDEGVQRFVLDMSGLEFISSMGLRSLIVAARQSQVVLCGMTEFVSRIVDLGGIARVVVIRETLDEAVASAAGMA